MEISRRGVLLGAAVGGGLLVAWGLRPRVFPTPLEPAAGEYAFDAWLKIAEDGIVTVAVPQLEMGQGVTTVLPQIVAQELGADWRQIAVEAAPTSGAYANVPLASEWAPLWMPFLPAMADDAGNFIAERFAQANRFGATADGSTLTAYETPCREAAAIARQALIETAADRWDISADACDSANGFVISADRRLPFGELAAEAAMREPAEVAPLRAEAAAERPLPIIAATNGLPAQGRQSIDFPRIDLPAKVDGSFPFAADIRLPDMLYAAIKHGPVADSTLVGFDVEAVADNPRVADVVKGKRWLAAVATDWWTASKAVEAMKPRFDVQQLADSIEAEDRLVAALTSDEAHTIVARGDDTDIAPQFARRYVVSPAAHATPETASVTARFADGRLELWMASQVPEQARIAAARAIGIGDDDVVLYTMAAGGSFDRRLEHGHAIEAALIAREVSLDRPRPVQLVWSRWQEHLAGLPRHPAAGLVWAQVQDGGDGTLAAIQTRIAAPSAGHEFGARLFGNQTPTGARLSARGKADPMAMAGALPVYAIPQAKVEHVPTDVGFPVGKMRGGAHGITAFMTESFIDEIAAEYGREPLSYRIAMLGNDPRMAMCLQRVAKLAQWDGGRDRSGQGLACHAMRGAAQPDSEREGRIACVAAARLDGDQIRVTRLWAAVDIGRIVNLDIARQQIEGGLIFGLSLALGAQAEYARGLSVAQRLADYTLPRLADCPEITVDFIASDAEPFDPGELGVAVCAPAIANALYSATGQRYRRLPLTLKRI
ncbi:MAG: molybdopterin cofactor-binding domain-containing protein [Pontixanthobacter sp.]